MIRIFSLKVEFFYEKPEEADTIKMFNRAIASEPSNRVATDDYRYELNYIEKHAYRSGITSLSALDEDYITYYSGVVFKHFSPYFETFNDVKIWFESNGIMEKWRWDTHYLSKKSDKLGPQVLTMDHLRIGFLTCLFHYNQHRCFHCRISMLKSCNRNQKIFSQNFEVRVQIFFELFKIFGA